MEIRCGTHCRGYTYLRYIRYITNSTIYNIPISTTPPPPPPRPHHHHYHHRPSSHPTSHRLDSPCSTSAALPALPGRPALSAPGRACALPSRSATRLEIRANLHVIAAPSHWPACAARLRAQTSPRMPRSRRETSRIRRARETTRWHLQAHDSCPARTSRVRVGEWDGLGERRCGMGFGWGIGKGKPDG
jgi:hypothetical protein